MSKVKAVRVIGLVLMSLAVLGIYLLVSYVLGGEYLKRVMGNDISTFLTHLKLMEQSFPHYVFWDYKEGAGVVLSYNYPPLIKSLIIFLSKISSFNVIEWTKILGFLSIPLFGFGVYLFSLVRLRLGLVGFMAGLFYILSPIAYMLLFESGFFVEAVAGILFPLVLLFFDAYLEQVFKKKSGLKRRIYFGLTVVFLSLALLSHPMVFMASALFIGFYGWLMAGWRQWRLIVREGLRLMIAVVMLTGFWLVPFVANNQIAAVGRVDNFGVDSQLVEYNDIDLKQVLSFSVLETEKERAFVFRHFSFPLALSLLVPIGVVMAAVLRRKKLLAGFVVGLLALGAAVSPRAIILLARLPVLASLAKNSWLWRVLIYADRLMIPILAAWGIYGLVYLIIFPFKFIKKRRWLRGLRSLVVVGLVLVLAGGWLWYWRNKPGEIKDRIRYGREVSECNVWNIYRERYCLEEPKTFKESLMDRYQWKEWSGQLFENDYVGLDIKEFLQAIPGGDFWRVSCTPRGGKVMMTAPLLTKNTSMDSYDTTSILFEDLLAFQQNNFFSTKDSVYVEPRAMPGMADWFGIRFVIENPEFDPVERLLKAGFIDRPELAGAQGFRVYEFPQAEPIVSLNNKPRILVISRQDLKVYDLVFKKALFNMISYDEAMLVNGGEHISQYSLEELKQFEMIWVYGHQYKNKRKAWSLLDEYVKQGGKLFMDTGWQYTTDDWEVGETAEFFPTTDLSWNELGLAKEYELRGDLIEIEGIETERFRPLIWEEKDWGVSTGEGLRDWAKPILSAKGKPLIAGGEYGEGRVIWSGMNILKHIEGYDWDNEEVKLMNRVVDWLLAGYGRDKLVWEQDYTGERPSPDRVELTINKYVPESYGLYFKEAYHPYWQAAVEPKEGKQTKLKIYKAGPDFKYVFLPELKTGDKLILWVTRPWWYGGLKILALLSLLGLGVYVVRPGWVKARLKWLERFKGKKLFSLGDAEEEDY